MLRKPSEEAFEAVARDMPVRAEGASHPASAHVRLAQGLQQLYEPVTDEQPDEFGALLAAIERCFADGSK